MTLIVQKFGGSSVGTPDRIGLVADRIAKRKKNSGVSLVVVVSAMQGETDRLLGLAHEVSDKPSSREMDQLLATGEQASAALLAMALLERGVQACSLTGTQMQMRTDGSFSRARILSVNEDAIQFLLKEAKVVVATGFQGIDAEGNITTLGRGGSDTSAVALAAGLGANECEIYTDVEGVFTADPRICPRARKLDVISFEEMMEMASQGSKVLQIRSVELAMNHNIPIRVRSTFTDDPGTLVTSEEQAIEKLVVRGVSHNSNEAKLTLRRVPDRPGIVADIFSCLAEAGINVDVIVQNQSEDGTTDVSFTVGRADLDEAFRLVEKIGPEIGADRWEKDDSIAKVSIVGVGMRAHAGVAAAMFRALQKANINIQMITTSEIKVTCVISREDVESAVQALHDDFALEGPAK
ncbi:MAG: aspartate kinase [Myxococcota bacterium]|nr:aspartate kinase [Myxococcota bacterium]